MPLQAVPVNITAFCWMPLITAFTTVCGGIGSCTRVLSACGNLTDIWAGLNRQRRIICSVIGVHFLIVKI